MKLINKISSYFLVSAVITLLVFSIFLFLIIESTIRSEADEQLLNIYNKIITELTLGKEVKSPPFVEINYNPSPEFKTGFKDVDLNTGLNFESEPYRQYSDILNLNGKNVLVTVRISLIEKDDMFFSIFLITLGSLILIVIIIFFINKYASQKTFNDFYKTLEKLESFSVSNNEALQLNKSNISEFSKLNEVVEKLSQKAKQEYRSLKNFTEETNHELQTPVAIVKTKLEMLLQSENLKEKDLNFVNSAINNLNKLERLSKSILLLNKLDHQNVFEDSQLNISEEIKNILSNYSDFIDSKKINLKVSLDEQINIVANHSLINILINNLISNSIKHNLEGGELVINLQGKILSVSNTGLPLKQVPEKMFLEFQKDNPATESAGLGLAIVKKICDLYSINIRYETINDKHIITLIFNPEKV